MLNVYNLLFKINMLYNITESNFCQEAEGIMKLVGYFINTVHIVVPIIIVLLGMIDLAKAVMASEEKDIKGAQKMFVKRLIYGIIVFLSVTIVKTVFGLVTEAEAVEDKARYCWQCVLDPKWCNPSNY